MSSSCREMVLTGLDFYQMSMEDMVRLSTYEVTKHRPGPNNDTTGTVFDARAGADRNRSCGTCGMGIAECPGHFGVIRLAEPILHPLMLQHVRDVMCLLCAKCHRTLLTEERVRNMNVKSRGTKRITELVRLVDKRDFMCMHCNAAPYQYKLNNMPTVKISKAKKKIHRSLCQINSSDGTKRWLNDADVAEIFDDVPHDDVEQVLRIAHPSRLILRAWPVLPPVCRHLENGRGDMQRDDDLTVHLCDIVRLNTVAADASKSDDERACAMADVKTKISIYCTNTAKVKRNDNGDPVRGVVDRIKGKNGLIRNNLLGKRSEMAGRTVIGPDPTLRLNEVGFPRSMAQHLYVPELVTESNFRWANSLRLHSGQRPRMIRNGKMRKDCELRVGDMVCRPLSDGDVVLMNRQPTLHKGSMMAFRIRLHDALTFTINMAVTKAYNADFDGDEMNSFIPQSAASQAELMELSTPTACLNSGDKASVCIVQDCLTAAYIMSGECLDSPTISRAIAFDVLLWSRCKDIDSVLSKWRSVRAHFGIPEHVYNGRILLIAVFPDMFYHRCGDLVIEDGVILKGRLTKRTLGPTRDSIIRKIGNERGPKAAGEFVDRLQFITTAWMSHNGFTVTADDFAHCGAVIESIARDKIDEVALVCDTIIDPELRESRINNILTTAKDIGMNVVRQQHCTCPNLVAMIESGSKGDYFNVGQTKGMLGQQMVNGARIPVALNEGRRSTVHSKFNEQRPAVLIRNRGFITRGFSNGLPPREWIYHCMSGRESVCASATETADTGYTTRRVNKFGEDIVIHNDGIVGDNNRTVYQMTYGDLGLDPESMCNSMDYIVRSVGGIPGK